MTRESEEVESAGETNWQWVGDQRKRGISRRTALKTAGAAGSASLLPLSGATTAAGQTSGGQQSGSPQPGPSVLYESPASAPQLENTGPWAAEPLLVSGTNAYVDGEYLSQDFIYDDKGANTTSTTLPPEPAPDHHGFGPMTGDIVYPTDQDTYHKNAADLLEFRAKPTEKGVVYRITLNSMTEPDAAAIAIGIDTDQNSTTGTDEWSYGIGTLGELGLEHVLVTWGNEAELDGSPVSSTVDLRRNQIEVEIPLEPNGETWRHYLVTGLFDTDTKEFKPIQESPDSDSPGGAQGKSPPPIFNVGFRSNEQEPIATPNIKPSQIGDELDEAIEERTGSRGVGYGHWREHAQATALTDRDISQFHANIDFGKLDAGTTTYNIPETGYINRIYASHHDLGVGIGNYPDSNGEDVIIGNLLPYSLYLPDEYQEDESHPFHVHLHSLSGTYNQYASWTPNFIRQVGEQRNSLVMTTTGRGPGVPYRDQAELDVFEAWGDAAARYNIDFDRVTLGGYSMGGIGTHQIGSKYPDLFAKAFPIVGSLGGDNTDEVAGNDLYTNNELIAANQRHIPLLMWQGTEDELAPTPLVLKYEQKLRDLGYRHELDIFPGYDHVAFGYRDQWGPGRDFLEGATVERNPPQVTYRAVPESNNEQFGLIHDKAYWVSDIEVVDGEPHGLVDIRSEAFGEAPPEPVNFEGEGTEPAPHEKHGTRWHESLRDPPPRNAFNVRLEEVGAMTVWVEEAQIDINEPITLSVDSSAPATIVLASSKGNEEVNVPAGQSERTVTIN